MTLFLIALVLLSAYSLLFAVYESGRPDRPPKMTARKPRR